MARTEGQRIVLLTGLILNAFALLNLGISFCTPYWVISWPRVYSPFRLIGLWEVCFAGMILPNDPSGKSYHGCWWIMAPELYSIRSWIMPPWFIVVQILITVSLCIEVLALIFNIIVFVVTKSTDKAGVGKKRAPFNKVQAMTYITLITAALKIAAVLIFGFAFKWDYYWLPNHTINWMSFSYGLAIVSAFSSIFSSIAHWQYRRIVLREYQQPATLVGPDIPPPTYLKM